MRFVVPLLLMASVAMPQVAHAKIAKPRTAKPARVARAARPAVHGSSLLGGAWIAPAASGLMAAAVAGVAATDGGLNPSHDGGLAPNTSAAPPVSPE